MNIMATEVTIGADGSARSELDRRARQLQPQRSVGTPTSMTYVNSSYSICTATWRERQWRAALSTGSLSTTTKSGFVPRV